MHFADSSPQCDDLQSPSKLNFAFSIFILVGILVSYLPQHIRLILRRSSEGISPYFVLLGTTSGTCAFANVLSIPESRHALGCCARLSGADCAAGLLGILQIGVQWACFAVILFLFILFFPRATPLAPPAKLSSSADQLDGASDLACSSTLPAKDDGDKKEENAPTYRTAVLIFTICIIHAFLVFLVTLVLHHTSRSNGANHNGTLTAWAYGLGVAGTILAAIQFLPQIWTTWRLQAVGSLSIPMMCIQTPGSFVWVASLAGRLGWAGWSTWGIYLVTGILQGCLLAMAILFEVRDRRRMEHNSMSRTAGRGPGDAGANGGARVEVDESTRLIGNER